MKITLTLAGALLPLAHAAAQSTTFIVDDDGGPGVHFTEIAPAVAVATDFDVILVEPGRYSPFVLSEGIVLVAANGAHIDGAAGVDIVGLPAGRRAALAGFTLDGILVQGCDGTVLLDGLEVGPGGATIDASTDVRVFECDSRGNLDDWTISGSRVELVQSHVVGGHATGPLYPGMGAHAGGSGLRVISSFLHVALSLVEGGQGGDADPAACGTPAAGLGGPGGTGILTSISDIVLAGAGTHVLAGGPSGAASCPWIARPDGAAMSIVGGSLRSFPGAFAPGSSFASAPYTSIPVRSSDATLELLDVPRPGGTVRMVVHGQTGLDVQLIFGRAPARLPVAGSAIESLTSAERTVSLPSIGGAGDLQRVLNVPMSWTPGTLVWLQAASTDPMTGRLQLTNSVPMLVR